MKMIQLIEQKRDGGHHTPAELAWLMRGAVDGSIPDYQLSAWLMAVTCRGMSDAEAGELTLAMARSGQLLDLSDLPGPVVDKHSTGGVGDKTTLVVVPLAAATGLTVAKMSGRGLGFTGGTLDKLESIPGLGVDLDIERFKRQARQIGCVIAGQTADLAPADRTLYALRDVTGTVPSLPLIAASIMSKKIAAGAAGLVLDVKFGRGAFMPTRSEARGLARLMVSLGRAAGRRVVAQLADMDQPLGFAVGNALEVREAIDTLHGHGPPDLVRHCLDLAGWLHVVAGRATRPDEVHPLLSAALQSGAAADKFAAMVAAQGGDAAVVADPERLAVAPIQSEVPAPSDGWVASVDARGVAAAALALGAGRARKGEPVDHGVGVVLGQKTGARVAAGDPLAVVYARSASAAEDAAARVLAAYGFGEQALSEGLGEPEVVQ